jgi:hypothetical protein
MVRLWLARQLAVRRLRFFAFVLFFGSIALGAPLAAGCTHVAPYQRGALARPDMTTGDLGGAGEKHAVAVHEGATRSGAVAESGCGCN